MIIRNYGSYPIYVLLPFTQASSLFSTEFTYVVIDLVTLEWFNVWDRYVVLNLDMEKFSKFDVRFPLPGEG